MRFIWVNVTLRRLFKVWLSDLLTHPIKSLLLWAKFYYWLLFVNGLKHVKVAQIFIFISTRFCFPILKINAFLPLDETFFCLIFKGKIGWLEKYKKATKKLKRQNLRNYSIWCTWTTLTVTVFSLFCFPHLLCPNRFNNILPDLEMVLFSSCSFTLRRMLFPSFFPSVFLSFIFSFLGHKWKMKRDGIVLLSCNILSHRPFVLILSFSLFLSLSPSPPFHFSLH
jgi:hypothetical protein